MRIGSFFLMGISFLCTGLVFCLLGDYQHSPEFILSGTFFMIFSLILSYAFNDGSNIFTKEE